MKTVYFDVDTQIDFLYPAGALYVPGAETIVERVAALNRFASANGVPLVSTMDAHSENDPEFARFPAHCVVGTAGQRKPASTLLEGAVVIPNSPCHPEVEGARQILLEKQTLDCFEQINLAALLKRLAAERYVVYGVVTEICVRFVAFGLLNAGKHVELVTDAVRPLDPAAGARVLAEFASRGGILTTTTTLRSGPPDGPEPPA